MKLQKLIPVFLTFVLLSTSASATDLVVSSARLYKKLTDCSGAKQACGIKAEYTAPTGQLFLRVEGVVKLAEGEKNVRGSDDIKVSIGDQEYVPITSMLMAGNLTPSWYYLGFALTQNTGFDLVFAVPENAAKGTFSIGDWRAEIKIAQPKDDAAPNVFEDVKLVLKKAKYVKSLPTYYYGSLYPIKAKTNVVSPTGTFLIIDVECEALKDRRLWGGGGVQIFASDFSVTVPNHQTFSAHAVITDSEAVPVWFYEDVEFGKPKTVSVSFMAPPKVKNFFLSFRGKKVTKAKVGR